LKEGNHLNNQTRSIGFGLIVLLLIGAAVYLGNQSPQLKEIPITEVASRVNDGEIKKIDQKGNSLEITLKGDDSAKYKSKKDPSSSLQEQGINVDKKGVQLNVDDPEQSGFDTFVTILPIISIALFIGLFFMIFRQAQGQGNQAMNFGKSKAKVYGEDKKKTTFKEIAGNIEAKEDLEEVVEFLKFPKKFQSIGCQNS
jgi:cell division protease FtsH